jgi:hypothetical protein
MKKAIILTTLIMGVLLVFSCTRREESQLNRNQTTDNFAEYTSALNSGIKNPGFALAVNTGIYVLDGEDDGTEATRVRWGAGLALAENIYIGEPRQLTFTGSGRVLPFVAIRRANGNEGWALVSQVAEGGRLAVVINERANLHTAPGSINVTGNVFTRRSVVVYYPETESGGFGGVRGWDIGRERFVDPNASFVRRDMLSFREADVQSAVLLLTALSLTTDAQQSRRDALLESALLDYPDSVFNTEIFEIANPNTSGIIYND